MLLILSILLLSFLRERKQVVDQIRDGFRKKHFGFDILVVKHELLHFFNDAIFVNKNL